MHPAVVTLSCFDRKGETVTVTRRVELPFVPTRNGIELGFICCDHDWSGEIASVVFELAINIFHVELEDWISSRFLLEEMLAELGPEWRPLGRVA